MFYSVDANRGQLNIYIYIYILGGEQIQRGGSKDKTLLKTREAHKKRSRKRGEVKISQRYRNTNSPPVQPRAPLLPRIASTSRTSASETIRSAPAHGARSPGSACSAPTTSPEWSVIARCTFSTRTYIDFSDTPACLGTCLVTNGRLPAHPPPKTYSVWKLLMYMCDKVLANNVTVEPTKTKLLVT